MLRLPGSYKLGRREREVHAKVEGGRDAHAAHGWRRARGAGLHQVRLEAEALMAHYIDGPDAPEAIRCPRCKLYRQPNGWTTVDGKQVPRSGDHIERPFDLPGYGPAWLCHDCAGDALAAVLAMLAEQGHRDLALAIVGVGNQQLLAAALEAAGLSKEGTG